MRPPREVRFVSEVRYVSTAGPTWLYDELARVRGLIMDARSNYLGGHPGEGDGDVMEALEVIRGIEIDFYGVNPPQRPARSESAAEVIDLAEVCSRGIAAQGKPGPARRRGA